jgi:hypothetical protein
MGVAHNPDGACGASKRRLVRTRPVVTCCEPEASCNFPRARRRCFRLCLALPCHTCRSRRRPRPTPSVFPSSTLKAEERRARTLFERCPSTFKKRLKSAPSPDGCRNSLGVGRVARRARLVIEPVSSCLPRLTLKAGHKAGLPTTPAAACGAPKCRIADSCFK